MRRMGQIVLGAVFATAILQAQTLTYSYTGGPLLILPSGDSDIYSIARIVVPTAVQISKVTARVKINYPQVGDLNLYLYSPAGTRTKLLERNCGNLRNIDTTFDDSAVSTFASFCPQEVGGSFRGNEPLNNSNGQSSIGVWRLAVQNNGGNANTGYLLDFAVTITGTTQLKPTFSSETIGNEASLTAGPIAPGERVTVYGGSLGPVASVTAPSGNLPTTLGGTTVTVNGTPAPIAYSSNLRLTFIAPSNLAMGSANVNVNYNSQDSGPIAIGTRSASPGIYTVAPGDARVKAINQDGALNSQTAPAGKGTYLTFYASGLGAVNPTVPDGTVTPNTPLSQATGLTAYVGGVPATISFAGLAPGLVGYYQVNLWIPSTAPSGTQSLVLVSASGAASQDGAFIYIQ